MAKAILICELSCMPVFALIVTKYFPPFRLGFCVVSKGSEPWADFLATLAQQLPRDCIMGGVKPEP